jgi:hypothetical protein
MPTRNEILSDPDVVEFLSSHQGTSDEIQKAAKELEGKTDAIPAIKKLFPALSKKEIRIFFSYKHQDIKTARTIVELLREYAGRTLQITYMGDFKTDITGEKWRQHIIERVKEANWFILLLPDPSEDWDWCLFETGLFEAQHTSADRLICLHHPDIELPGPIDDYQHVPATRNDVEKFLCRVFVEDNPIPGMRAINPKLHKKVPKIAKKIVDAIVPPCRPLFRDIFEPWIELRHPKAAVMKNMEDLDEALLLSANKRALGLFGFVVPPQTFGDLRSGLTEYSPSDGRWLSELFHVIRKSAQGREFFPIQGVFQRKKDGKMYRPVLCAVDRKSENGPIETYHLTFVEEVSHIDDTAIPRHVAVLTTLLRLAYRFRWEVLARYGGRTLTEDDLLRIKNAIKRIEKDWESRGMSTNDPIGVYFSQEKGQRVEEIASLWRATKNKSGTGELDMAMAGNDTQSVSKILKEFIPINQEFVEITANRFAELASEKWV